MTTALRGWDSNPQTFRLTADCSAELSYPGSALTVLPRRFWAKVQYAPDGCWLWTGAKTANGYGSWGVNGRTRSTHRTAYEALIGPVPDGLQIDHLCRVRLCCNPLHAEPVTNTQNQQRSPLTPLGKTHCKRGHPLSGENLRVPSRGTRICAICQRERSRAARDKGPAQPIPANAHGTKNGYSYYKCRCPDCVEAWNAYYREYMAARRARRAQRQEAAA